MALAAMVWARADLRARWPSLIALGVLVAAVGGLSVAALAGARRTHSSFDRLRERTDGRLGWRLVTERVPLDFVSPLALAALVVLPPLAMALVNLLAIWPGRRAARLRPAEVLRAE